MILKVKPTFLHSFCSLLPGRVRMCHLTCSEQTESRSLAMDTASKPLTGTPNEKQKGNLQLPFAVNRCTGGLVRLCLCGTCQAPGLRRTALVVMLVFLFCYNTGFVSDCEGSEREPKVYQGCNRTRDKSLESSKWTPEVNFKSAGTTNLLVYNLIHA